MNYREFTERVYNYKHGLTNSAESQNIEHSAKQTEETNENEHIEHSGQGQSWDQHKYIRKEYLGNGNWRYIYEDGSSNVTNASNEKEADVKEGAYQANKTYGNGAPQNTKTISDTAKKLMTPRGQSSPADTGFTQARKDMYKELGEKAADYNKQLSNFEGMVKGLEQSNADQEAAKLKAQNTNIANNLAASQKETEDRKMYVDLANKARDYNKQLEGFQGVVKGLEQSNADQAESARQAEREALAAKAQARSDRYDKMANLDVNTAATPYQQLQNQGTTAVKNAQANEILTTYEDGIVTDVLEPLRKLGIPDDAIWATIEQVENEIAGEAITNSLRDVGSEKQVLFFPGAEEGLKIYRDQVMPKLLEIVASETATRKANKVNELVNSLDEEEKALLLASLGNK